MMKTDINLSRPEKILLVLFRLSKATKRKIRFEDIAVTAFKTFPQDFQLKGYPQYPDSGDIIHKPLYSELKKVGYVLSGNKYFSLTRKGLQMGKTLNDNFIRGTSVRTDSVKFTRDQQSEIEDILSSTAYRLFAENKKEEILDIDFYNYLGVTVRTSKYDFLGRLNSVEDAIKAVGIKKPELGKSLFQLHEYILKKFKDNVNYFENKKGGRG